MSRVVGSVLVSSLIAPAAWGWGQIGHRASGYVAEAFLSPQAKQGVVSLLKKQRMADAAVWADTLRGNEQLKHISPYHYDSVPAGMPYLEYVRRLPKDKAAKGGILQAILIAERELENPRIPAQQKEASIRFLIHFIGDIHQPFHSGRPDDKGGNAISVNWFGHRSNLHSVWDTGLILSGHPEIFGQAMNGVDQSLTYARFLIEKHKGLTPPNPSRDNPEAWLMESVVEREPAYNDTDYKGNQQAYTNRHVATVDMRVYAAGLRIADVLNRIFANVAPPNFQVQLTKNIEAMIGALDKIITLGPRQFQPPVEDWN